MRIAILSDTRHPTLPDGGHGLGRSAWDIATGLLKRGHEVTLYAAAGSQFDRQLISHEDEIARSVKLSHSDHFRRSYDAILDTTHHHQLSKNRPVWPVVNRVCDMECKYAPPNAVTNSPYMQGRYGGKLVNTGVDVEAIPFFPEHDGYVVFVGKQEPRKGWPRVKQVAQEAGLELRTVDGLTGDEKWQAIGRAMVLLHPSVDAAPRTPLEAAACGVPTVCLNEGGTPWHVANGVTGYAVRGWEDMAYWVKVSDKLNRQSIRNWANDCHNLSDMIDGYEDALMSVANGVMW